tara:strand:- start:571 stop:720 length:150 start_codon:yes stop_codon:yes gene_type:complete
VAVELSPDRVLEVVNTSSRETSPGSTRMVQKDGLVETSYFLSVIHDPEC